MGFLKNMFMAILSAFNPLLGFIGSVIEYITSSSNNSITSFLLNVVNSIIPMPNIASGFIKDITAGLISDAIEVGTLKEAAEEIVPYNDIALKCDVCGVYKKYFLRENGLIKCKECYEKKLNKEVKHGDKVYIFKNGIYELKDEIVSKNSNKIIYHSTYSKNSYEDVYSYAYRSNGMDKNKSNAKSFAEFWMKNFDNKSISTFKEIYSFAYSINGMDKNRSNAQDFAVFWMKNFDNKSISRFKEIYSFAYSNNGMDKNRSNAQDFAVFWIENYYDKSITSFKEFYSYAYSSNGLDKNRSNALSYALNQL